jgi:outer membrane protein OmpA-like peptidoglycan-associated protein
MHSTLPTITWLQIPLLLLLGSCGSPPKPPSVNESLKRPANSAAAVDLQACKSSLHNLRIVAHESDRAAEATATDLARLVALQQALAATQMAKQAAAPSGPATPASEAANRLFTIHFDFGSSRVVVPPDAAAKLIESARAAPLVMLRGRTDGHTESAAESQIARERATAVRDYLVGAGVDPTRIRATYQPVGDHAAANDNLPGRGMNRRVEVEIYRVLPVAISATAAPAPN